MGNQGVRLNLVFGIELNGESLRDKREALRGEKGGLKFGEEEKKIREKREKSSGEKSLRRGDFRLINP